MVWVQNCSCVPFLRLSFRNFPTGGLAAHAGSRLRQRAGERCGDAATEPRIHCRSDYTAPPERPSARLGRGAGFAGAGRAAALAGDRESCGWLVDG